MVFMFMVTVNDQRIPVSELTDDNQNTVNFDDFVCEKNQTPLIEYFIRGRHKNCSVIYLSQSYYKTPKISDETAHIFVFMNSQATMKNH